MTRAHVQINHNTIRRNPDAGRTSMFVSGRTVITTDPTCAVKSIDQDIQRVNFMTPLPAFLYEYYPTRVKCDNCGREFLHTELESDTLDDGTPIFNICPHCGESDCCLITYEEFSQAELAAYALTNETRNRIDDSIPKIVSSALPKDELFRIAMRVLIGSKEIESETLFQIVCDIAKAFRCEGITYSEAWKIIQEEKERQSQS